MLLHKSLKKFLSWPIPYWFMPISILMAVGYWHGFNWKVNSENWPFWLWLIDKGITVGSIIFAALLAQKIFNENARKRENRERRLESVINVLEQLSSLGDKLTRFYNSKEDDISPIFQDVFTQLIHISIFTKLYYPELTGKIAFCHKSLSLSKTELESKIREFQTITKGYYRSEVECGFSSEEPYTYDQLYKTKRRMNSELISKNLMITDQLEEIMHRCIDIHKQIEKQNTSP